jgi:transcriptional regulator GlxA family with amidase domain
VILSARDRCLGSSPEVNMLGLRPSPVFLSLLLWSLALAAAPAPAAAQAAPDEPLAPGPSAIAADSGGAAPAAARPDPIDVVIVLYDGVELGDLSGPWEVFSAASELTGGRFRVSLAAESDRPVTLHRGPRMLPDCTLATCPPADILVVPGGQGVFQAMESTAMIDYLRRADAGAGEVVTICVGSFLLARAGLLDGRTLTTHDLGLGYLRQLAPGATVVDERWVDGGKLLSAGGVSPSIDLSLHLVARRLGAEAAQATARHLDHPWEPAP